MGSSLSAAPQPKLVMNADVRQSGARAPFHDVHSPIHTGVDVHPQSVEMADFR
jgi:hypothetical protein